MRWRDLLRRPQRPVVLWFSWSSVLLLFTVCEPTFAKWPNSVNSFCEKILNARNPRLSHPGGHPSGSPVVFPGIVPPSFGAQIRMVIRIGLEARPHQADRTIHGKQIVRPHNNFIANNLRQHRRPFYQHSASRSNHPTPEQQSSYSFCATHVLKHGACRKSSRFPRKRLGLPPDSADGKSSRPEPAAGYGAGTELKGPQEDPPPPTGCRKMGSGQCLFRVRPGCGRLGSAASHLNTSGLLASGGPLLRSTILRHQPVCRTLAVFCISPGYCTKSRFDCAAPHPPLAIPHEQ